MVICYGVRGVVGLVLGNTVKSVYCDYGQYKLLLLLDFSSTVYKNSLNSFPSMSVIYSSIC